LGKTIAEKILARASGLREVSAGDEVLATPDFVLAYDWPGQTDVMFREMKENLGIKKIADPKRIGFFIDHMVPSATAQEEETHIGTRKWCSENEVDLFERRGIGHQVASEVGFAVPGAFVVHFDPHISQLGAFGTLALGLRRNVLEALVRKQVPVKVPATVRIDLEGELPKGVMARDVFHHIVRLLGPSSCRFQVLEIGGLGAENISTEGLQTITGLAMFTGALTAIVNPAPGRLAYATARARKQLEPQYSDADAVYSARHRILLDELEPIVVVPPSPANTELLTAHAGLEVHSGYLGSCASGRLEELRVAAKILKGRQVHPGFSLHVVPTSQEIMAAAAREGIVADLVEAGAFVSSSSCDYCYGRIATMTAGQRAVSTGTLNVRGRMGSVDSEIYLCNAATIAASALNGKITDPRPYL
jgi:3-isopropylmalate/(R)-2-methylmalate dehydratase large subunit